MPIPNVGDAAPDFDLPGTGGERYSLARYVGKPVVLVFYPGDNTAVCTVQLKSYNSEIDEFDQLGAQVLGLSPQNVESHENFSCQQGFNFPLLADTDKAVGKAYGIVGPLGFYRRSIFVVDGAGVVRYAHRSMTGITFKPSKELIEAVKALQ
jgi:peroxiredoxin Q/BCP